jgi:hypothetical protein
MPADSISRKEVTEELGNNAKTICFQTVDRVVILDKRGFEELIPHAVDFAETLTNHAKEFVVCAFLRATLDNHRR